MQLSFRFDLQQLLDEFILPSSRTYVDLIRQRENDSDIHIQRSVTHSAISRGNKIEMRESFYLRSVRLIYTLRMATFGDQVRCMVRD